MTTEPSTRRFAIDDWRGSDGRQLLDLRLYAVTDTGCNARCGRSNAEAVLAAVEGGSTMVQLREKDTDGANFCREAEAVLAVTRPRGVSPSRRESIAHVSRRLASGV